MEPQVKFTLEAPDKDFDFQELLNALIAVESALNACPDLPWETDERRGLTTAYRILYTLHFIYVEALGRPEWLRPRR